jgi:hypothetical protein
LLLDDFPDTRLEWVHMKNIIYSFFAFSLSFSALAASPQLAYNKSSGYTGMKKSLLYQALGSRKVYRRLV